MAHQPETNLLSFLGWIVWGDLGELTIYRNRKGKMVAFKKTWPKEPASPDQKTQRDKFRAAATAWNALTPAQQNQWNLATRRAPLTMGGYALFVHWTLIQDAEAIQTLERQTNTTLLPP